MEFKPQDIFFKKHDNRTSEFLKAAIDGLKSEDDMAVLNTLYELSSNLSLANDSIAEDPNCVVLLKELLVQIDKYYIFPEIAIAAMQSINNLLDINPRYSTTIIKNKGAKKIVGLTQNIEFIDLAESAIKCIEKMSLENPYVLLEENAFLAILTIIDFFDLSLKKSAVKSCFYMTKSVNSYDHLKNFILPAIPCLTSITKFNGSTDIEKQILDICLQIFYYIFVGVKTYGSNTSNNEIIHLIISHGLIDCLMDVFNRYAKDKSGEGNAAAKTNTNLISTDSIKLIIKILDLLSSLSIEAVDLILNMNILETVYFILAKEIVPGGTKINSSSNIYVEILSFLISLFPKKKNSIPEKLVAPQNKSFYFFFSEKILAYLIQNIINIQSSSTTVQIIKLIEFYIIYSDNENILVYINASKLANICAKMLDSKDSNYILEILNLVDTIMKKVPEHYIISFIREGVADNIAALTKATKNEIYVYEDKSERHKKTIDKADKSKYVPADDMNEDNEDFYDEEDDELIDEESADKYGSSNADLTNRIQKMMANINKLTNVTLDKDKNESLDTGSAKKEETASLTKTIQASKEKEASPSKLNSHSGVFGKNKTEIFSTSYTSQAGNSNPSLEKTKSTPIANVESSVQIPDTIKSINSLALSIHSDYFSDNQVSLLLGKLGITSHPKEIINTLKSVSDSLNGGIGCEAQIEIFRNAVKRGVTFYEVETTQIFEALANYFDSNFGINYARIILDDNKPIECCGNFNKELITKLKTFLNLFELDKSNDHISNLLEVIQNSITSMNCFKLMLYDTTTTTFSQYAHSLKSQVNKFKVKLQYKETDPNLICKLSEESLRVFEKFDEYLTKNRSIYVISDINEVFSNVKEQLLSAVEKELIYADEGLSKKKSGGGNFESILQEVLLNRKGSEDDHLITERFLKHLQRKGSNPEEEDQIKGDDKAEENEASNPPARFFDSDLYKKGRKDLSEMIEVSFFVEVGEKKVLFEKNWTINDFTKELKNIFSKQEYLAFGRDLNIKFNFTTSNQESHVTSGTMSSQPNITQSNINFKVSDYSSYIQYLNNEFMSNYNTTVVNNTNLFLIKRLSPFLYVLSLLELAINDYHILFTENPSMIAPLSTDSLENKKVTSLILKQAKDPFAVSSLTIPAWCRELCSNFTFICGFNSRYLLFKTSTFDSQRSIKNLYVYLKNFMGETIADEASITQATSKNRIVVSRNNIIKSAEELMMRCRKNQIKGYLDFEFEGEVGTGTGPTLEFYSTFLKECSSIKGIWMKSHDKSYFPMPIMLNQTSTPESQQKLDYFKTLGFIIARAIYDDRLIDFPMSSLFWDILLGRSVSLRSFVKIDPYVFKILNELSNLIHHGQDRSTLSRYLDDLGVDFSLPGYPSYLIKNNGDAELLNSSNINEYLLLIYDALCKQGVQSISEAFTDGFNIVFPLKSLRCFSSDELEEIICGASSADDWDLESLESNINTNHGYTKKSQTYSFLTKFMLSLNKIEKKAFILFVTGCPRLPIGGLKNLNPKLTIVKTQFDKLYEDPAKYLPTVMT